MVGFQIEERPFPTLFVVHSGGELICDGVGAFESTFSRKHREYHSSPIEGTQAKHRTHTHAGPMREFLGKQTRSVPHLFRKAHQSRPLSFVRSGCRHSVPS